MVRSIKKPKMKKYKGKRKDRKYRTANKKLPLRRSFKSRKHRGGAAAASSAAPMTLSILPAPPAQQAAPMNLSILPAPPAQQDESEKQELQLRNIKSSVWWDSMHDHTNYKATQSTVNEDEFMTEPRNFPTRDNTNFLTLFEGKYSFEPKAAVINALKGEMRIKDIYSGSFLGFALNEFIDQADTSTLNYLKYYETYKGPVPKPFTGPFGLPENDFPNSFLYNCDKLLYQYFLLRDPNQQISSDVSYVQNSFHDWSTENCQARHVYSLNGFWKTILDTIQEEIKYGFDQAVANKAVQLLRKIVFTRFERIGNPNGNGDYRKLLYKYPKFTYDDNPKFTNAGNGNIDGDFYYTTTQSLCARNIPESVTGQNVKPRPEGKETKEQRSCFQGLNEILNGVEDVVKGHFFMLLKYIGDTSHLILYNILKSINGDAIDKSNLGIYLSERPLLVRAFAQNMNIYCKYLSKFSEKNIIKRPGEVIRISNEAPEVINAKRADSYRTDLDALKGLIKLLYKTPATDDNYWNQYSLSVTQIGIPVSDEDMTKVNYYHPIIKQILSCHDLIGKTNTFIGDMEFVNKTIIPSNFFARRRSMVLSKISSFISSFIDSAIQKKNRERFNRALEYLNAFHSILVPATDNDELSKWLVKIRHNQLYAEITKGAKRFKKVCEISIPQIGTKKVRDLREIPHILRNWIEDNYLVMKQLSPSSSQGIQNITDYLIMYDFLMHNIPQVALTQLGGGPKQSKLINPDPIALVSDEDDDELFDLDSDIEEEELGAYYENVKQIDEDIENINIAVDTNDIQLYTKLLQSIKDNTTALQNKYKYINSRDGNINDEEKGAEITTTMMNFTQGPENPTTMMNFTQRAENPTTMMNFTQGSEKGNDDFLLDLDNFLFELKTFDFKNNDIQNVSPLSLSLSSDTLKEESKVLENFEPPAPTPVPAQPPENQESPRKRLRSNNITADNGTQKKKSKSRNLTWKTGKPINLSK